MFTENYDTHYDTIIGSTLLIKVSVNDKSRLNWLNLKSSMSSITSISAIQT